MLRQPPRHLGLWMGQMETGFYNDITDVPGVRVGHVSLIKGKGKLIPGEGPVRTGVTAVLPTSHNLYRSPLWAGVDIINGYGKSIGISFIKETGILNCPVLLTNTLSVNDAANGLLTYLLKQNQEIGNDARTPNLVVLECDDSYLNDIRGRHVKPSDAILAINRAQTGPIAQGNVGAGVGMSLFQLKGGIGSASRIIKTPGREDFTLGILALCNFGLLQDLLIDGVPVGEHLKMKVYGEIPGSLIIMGITNAPLSRWQLERLARRSWLGTGRTGSISMTGSGDFCMMVSTVGIGRTDFLSDWELDDFNRAVVEATAESIWNALFLAETLDGRDGHVRFALALNEVQKLFNHFYHFRRLDLL